MFKNKDVGESGSAQPPTAPALEVVLGSLFGLLLHETYLSELYSASCHLTVKPNNMHLGH